RQKSQCHSPLVSCVSWVDPQLTHRWGASSGSRPSSTGSGCGSPWWSGSRGSSGGGGFSSGVTRAGYWAASADSTAAPRSSSDGPGLPTQPTREQHEHHDENACPAECDEPDEAVHPRVAAQKSSSSSSPTSIAPTSARSSIQRLSSARRVCQAA